MTVRTSLLAVLLLFTAMILVGAALGIFALRQANQAMDTMHHVSTQVMTINDAYKDTTRSRSALTRAYTTVKDAGSQADRDSALASAKKSSQRTLDFLTVFEKAAPFADQDLALKKGLVEAGRSQSAVLERATAALAQNDAATYTTIQPRAKRGDRPGQHGHCADGPGDTAKRGAGGRGCGGDPVAAGPGR